jgi:leucyl-tRNA synthetase
MATFYNHQEIEKKWQERWEKEGQNQAKFPDSRAKKYILDMFPYPSGFGLHVGHLEGYTATDIVSRYWRFKGFNVLHPMGWDSFGLPTENFAIKEGGQPQEITAVNVDTFRRQIKAAGLSYDWKREVTTSAPDYYRWTQWLFLQLYKKGLAYKKEAPVNWCDSCKTVLANEQVVNGLCERCSNSVIQKNLNQWFFKITAYAEELLKGIDGFDWSDALKSTQKNWIGKSEGAQIDFLLPKFKEVFLASTNASKKLRIEKLLADKGIKIKIVTAKDLGLEPIEVNEDGDLLENAKQKALAYLGKVDLPILAGDSGFFIEGEKIDPVKVKRNALNGEDENNLSQEQIAEKLSPYYQEIARKHGGEVAAFMRDTFALVLPDGEVVTTESDREVILTDKIVGKVDIFLPIRSLYKSKATGKYVADQDEAEVAKELSPYSNSLVNLLCEKVTVFTTRPDTLCGATYMVVAPEHEIIRNFTCLAESRRELEILNYNEVEKYVVEAKHKNNLERTDLNKDKTGVELKGLKAINPATNEEIPIFVADYVVTGYGTGAIMAVPAHDERDFIFAKKFNLPITEVIMPTRVDPKNPPQNGKKTVTRKTIHALVRNPKTGLVLGLKWKEQPWTGFVVGGVDEGEDIVTAAKREVLEETGYKNLRLIRVLGGAVKAEYFAAHKDENRIAYVNAILFELENEERTVVSEEEQAKHEPVWLDLKTLNHDNFTCAELDLWLARVNNEIDSYSGDGILINSGKFDGLTSVEAKDKIIEEVGGQKQTNYKIRDWLVSRQRYWGAPIPIIYCEDCGEVPVLEKDLPVLLPTDVDFRPTGESPLARSEDFKKVKCPKCGKPARREVDTMDTFVCSSWYFLRYADANNDQAPFSKDAVDYFLPIDLYVGGMEHAVGHLLFSRFITKFLRDEGLLKIDEPFLKMRNQGTILASDSRKMSKRWGNVINPDDVIEAWGADSVRLYEMFMGPLEEHKPWQDQGILGVRRFLEKVYRLTSLVKDNKQEPDAKIEKLLQQLINKVGIDIEALHFNTAIAVMMEFLNQANEKNLTAEQFNRFLILLAPFAPHMAEECWEILGNKNSIFGNTWPEFNSALAKEDVVKIVIQVNGKLRETISVAIDLSETEVIKLALESENIKKYLVNGEYKKAIFVPNRLLNLVV